jgi:hypothetical protein
LPIFITIINLATEIFGTIFAVVYIMKHFNKICALFFILISISAAGYAQQQPPMSDTLGLPGDNLNLYGVLYLFKESANVQDFEQRLNSPDSKVNNLDLNHDGQTDYIQVIDYGQNGLHSLVLRDAISATESQDVAVIEIEQRGNGVAHVQIVGDEALYGKNYIIEPQDQQQQQIQPPPPVNNYNPNPPILYNVWGWPCIQFMYAPNYVYWHSPWYWGYYPGWWRPWSPFGFHAYWYNMYGYRGYQRRVYYNHMAGAYNIYYGHRMMSPIVHGYIRNNTYYGPRMESGGGRREVGPNNAPRNVEPRRDFNGGRQQGNFNNQPRQQAAPRQQAPRNMGGGGGHGGGGGRRR